LDSFFGLKFKPAIITAHAWWHTDKVERGALTNCALADEIPIKLNRVIHNARKPTEDNMNVGHSASIGSRGVLQGDGKDTFGDG